MRLVHGIVLERLVIAGTQLSTSNLTLCEKKKKKRIIQGTVIATYYSYKATAELKKTSCYLSESTHEEETNLRWKKPHTTIYLFIY